MSSIVTENNGVKRKHDGGVFEKVKKKKNKRPVENVETNAEPDLSVGKVKKKKKKKREHAETVETSEKTDQTVKNSRVETVETKEESGGERVEETLRVNARERTESDSMAKPKKVRESPTVSIAVPGSILDNAQSPEFRTYLAGQIARAACIYKIDEVCFFVRNVC